MNNITNDLNTELFNELENELSAETQWEIDKNLGILDWAGEGLTEKDMEKFRNHYEKD